MEGRIDMERAAMKILEIVFYRREHDRDRWQYNLRQDELDLFLVKMSGELAAFGVALQATHEDTVIRVNGYADLLNSVRLRFPSAGLGNLCLGHVIGSSPNCDLLEDLRRGINRLVFAPETVEPDGSDKIVCHNCGCGC